MDTAASARAFTDKGIRARQNLMELKMAMVVKAWEWREASVIWVPDPPGAAASVTHVRGFELQADQCVHQEGGDGGERGDDAGEAGVCVLNAAEKPNLLLFSFPQV